MAGVSTDGPVPSAARALRVLRHLASQPEPQPVSRIAAAVGVPRSSAYHLLATMVAQGFVVHLEDEARYALGVAAFEVGSGYARHAPLQRIARRRLAELVDRLGESAHVAVLHGRDVYYVAEERAPHRPSLVSDVGVRLPAALTASGRAMLAAMTPAQVRALYPDRDSFVALRSGVGPASLPELRSLLAGARQRGYAVEDGEVTDGLRSVALAVRDPTAYPVGAVAVTFERARVGPAAEARIVAEVRAVADGLSHRL